MHLSNISKETIHDAVLQATEKAVSGNDYEVITDFHLILDTDTGNLSILDDNDTILTSVIIDEWSNFDTEDSLKTVASSLTAILRQMNKNGNFKNVNIFKPFSFVLEGDDREAVEELFIVDDDNVFLNGDLLQNLDKDLDDFLDQLMKEE